jgi:anti-sigma factor RsiW
MSCWHFRLQGKILPYLDGELAPPQVSRLERHLLDCQWCRERLLRLRAASQFARQLPRVAPWGDADSDFEALTARAAGRRPRARIKRSWGVPIRLGALVTPRVVTALVALVVLQSALLIESNRGVLFGQRTSVTVRAGALDLGDFRALRVSDIRANTQPEVVTQGYVSDVHTDREEGTVAFKLAEDRQGAGPFVVCEIIAPINVAAPAKGSYVRVYGVTRYDGQSDRRWYEINPVLQIKSVNDPRKQ